MEGEAAASGTGRGRSTSAALGEFCAVDSLQQCRHLHKVLNTWREVWALVLQGSSAGIVCNGPQSWVGFLKGHALSGLCDWVVASCAAVWSVRAISREPQFLPLN